jgi:hypothetical protein
LRVALELVTMSAILMKCFAVLRGYA